MPAGMVGTDSMGVMVVRLGIVMRYGVMAGGGGTLVNSMGRGVGAGVSEGVPVNAMGFAARRGFRCE